MMFINTRSLIAAVSIFAGARAAWAGAADAANGANQSQRAAEMASQMMSAALLPTCAQQPMPPTCPMGLLSAMQAASLGGNKSQAEAATQTMSTGIISGQQGPTSTPINGESLTGTVGGLDMAAARSGLAKLGYSLSKDGSQLTLPNGKTIASGAFGTAGGMTAAGFSASQISEAQAKVASVQADIKSKLRDFSVEGGTGTGGGGGASGSSGGVGPASFSFRMPGAKRGTAPSVSGMTKNFGGDKIGVAGDNIFEMITRRYKSQDTANGFFKN